jgi:pyruvate/2-oxoglutarate dehydrogenase complex dihydrolipoamide dehydrogenase (E3) component
MSQPAFSRAFLKVTVPPLDEFNQDLVSQVHPPDWVNPVPPPRYDLVVIGAGTAGLVVAAGAAGLGLGLRVALIERYLMGGDCLNVGCVPSKCVIRSSRVVSAMRDAEAFGIQAPERITVDFPAVMARMRKIRAHISHHDAAARFRNLGVDVFLGEASFSGADSVSVDGQMLRFKRAVIATGARAATPPLVGLAEAGYLTNETVFSLTERPPRLAVIGGGPLGCELAQAFHRLGCEVVVLHRGKHLLGREDSDAAELIQNAFLREGIGLVLGGEIQQITQVPEGKLIRLVRDGQEQGITVDEILVGTGRVPNVEGLNLEAAGVEYDRRRGVQVNDFLQTRNRRIYAAGDICMDWKFTHAADAAARIVIKNALFAPFGLGRSRLSGLVMPWTTYTDPEVAHVGLYEREARDRGIPVVTIKIPLHQVDRAIADGEEAGFIKIHHRKGSDQILGATIVARHAGEMIGEVTLAMVAKRGLNTLSSVIHPYPTQAEGIKKAADAYRRTLLTPRTRTLLRLLTRLS